MFIAGILWVVGDIMGVFGFGGENVGHIAHLSGVGVGILFGFILRFLKFKKVEKKDKIDLPEEYVRVWEDKNL